MPEGDTVLAAANNLHRVLAGNTLVRGDLNWPSAPAQGIVGCRVIEVDAYAKHMFFRLDNGTSVRTHLRMEGVWSIVPAQSREARRPSPHVRAQLATETTACLGYWLGMLDVLPTVKEADLLAHMGPDILSDRFVPTPFLSRARLDPTLRIAPRRASGGLGGNPPELSDDWWRLGIARYEAEDQSRPIGESMLDQTLVSGMGTIYLAEGLFAMKVSPWRPIGEVDIPRLLASTRQNMIRSVTDYPRGRRHHAHGRVGEPCHACGTLMKVAQVGPPLKERPAFYCPRCQEK